ncbi:MAG: LysR family transcriptional regulator [Alphaproteobacteria bacterium]|nr:LysR family transcriptional regulator [Alphaproteobacteria bacterium]
MRRLATTLEQWRAAAAVADAGGFQAAARALAKSQSSVSHAVAKLADGLGVALFETRGRRAEPTAAGEVLLRRARRLLEDAAEIEATAAALARGWEAELTVAVDTILPTEVLMRALNRFADEAPASRVQVMETVLSGTHEALTHGIADLAVSGFVPEGFRGEALMDLEFVAVAHVDHALNHLGRALDFDDLARHRQLVVRDSGSARYDSGWLGAERRWTFSSLSSSIEAIRHGSGFAWVPRDKISRELADGSLRPLPLGAAGSRRASLYVILRAPDHPGPAARALADAFIAEAVAARGADEANSSA